MTHLILPLRLTLLLAAFSLSACATAKPEVKVIAMSQAKTSRTLGPQVLVYMEVVNPTGRDLTLSRLDYRLSADTWFESNGSVDLARNVPARSSSVVEIAVPALELQGRSTKGVPYQLKGRLFAHADRVQRSWKVDANGKLETHAASFRIRGAGERVGTATDP